MQQSDGITKKRKWIGVDFDETLRRYDGTPIQAMVNRVQAWLADGVEVRIITARVAPRELSPNDDWIMANGGLDQVKFVQDWLESIGLPRLAVQWGKSPGMLELWDDKVVRVEANTGRRLSPSGMEYDDPCNRCGSMVKCDHDE